MRLVLASVYESLYPDNDSCGCLLSRFGQRADRFQLPALIHPRCRHCITGNLPCLRLHLPLICPQPMQLYDLRPQFGLLVLDVVLHVTYPVV